MRRIISALLLCISTTGALAQEGKPLELAPDAPDRHIVVPGDTLWGISAKFLRDPYRWPEIWRMNPDQIKNPHRIYPGQVIILDTSGGQPQLKLGNIIKAEPRIYVEEDRKEIPAIPQQVIEPFLSEPLVVEAGTLETSPRIVATQESRVNVGAGGSFYARDVQKSGVKLWQVFRPGAPLKDPETGEVLGHEAFYLGSARVIADGEPATLEIVTAKQEIGRGDSLIPASKPDVLSYLPHAPSSQLKGRIMTLYGGVGEGGRHSIVSLNRGTRDGLERGHVLAIYRKGATVTNRFIPDKPEFTVLPDERYGLLFVFRTFDRISYALVMEGSRPVQPGDLVQTP
jgi:hypothetical protein